VHVLLAIAINWPAIALPWASSVPLLYRAGSPALAASSYPHRGFEFNAQAPFHSTPHAAKNSEARGIGIQGTDGVTRSDTVALWSLSVCPAFRP
jgi:hypothetical protein